MQTLLYGLLVYSMIGFDWTAAKFLWYMFFMFFTFLYFTYYGMMAVAMTPNSDIAAIVAAAFYAIWNIFAGFIIPRPVRPPSLSPPSSHLRWLHPLLCALPSYMMMAALQRIPIWWRWYYWACPVAWTLYGLVVSQFGEYTDTMSDVDETVKDFLRRFLGFRHDFLPVVGVMVVVFTVLFASIFAFSIKTLNFQRR